MHYGYCFIHSHKTLESRHYILLFTSEALWFRKIVKFVTGNTGVRIFLQTRTMCHCTLYFVFHNLLHHLLNSLPLFCFLAIIIVIVISSFFPLSTRSFFFFFFLFGGGSARHQTQVHTYAKPVFHY